MNRFSLLFVGLLSWLPGLQAASIYSLAGSYTSLPVEWRELSLLHGAIALETGMLKRLYTIDGLSVPSDHARKLVKEIFYQVPDTDEFTVSKNITEKITTDIVEGIITYIARLGILQKIQSSNLQDNKKNTAKNILTKNLPKIAGLNIKAAALASEPEIAIAILTGALWYIKKTMPEPNFNYQELLIEEINEAKKLVTDKQIKKILEPAKDTPQPSLNTTQNATLSAEDYEKSVIAILSKSVVPNIHPEHLNYQKATVLIDENQSERFADCMETTMRNLFNILTYDPKIKSLSAEHLQSKFPNARPELINFYTNYPKFSKSPDTTDASQKDQAAYNAWAQLVSNVPGVQYNRPKEDAKKTYELQPSYPNILILTNYLLGLNWFDNLQQYPNKPDDFTKTHMAKFIELFGSADKPITALEEYGKLTINTASGYAFTIGLTQDHGKMQYGQQETDISLNAAALAAYPQLYNLMPLEIWPKTPDSLWHLFSKPIENPDFSGTLSLCLKYIPYSWITVLEEMINKHPDPDLQILQKSALYEEILKKYWDTYTETEKNRIINASIALVKDQDSSSTSAIGLLIQLVNKDKAFDEAIAIAKQVPQNPSLLFQQYGLLLLTTLVTQGRAFKEAIDAAENTIKSNNNKTKKMTDQLLTELVKHQEALGLIKQSKILNTALGRVNTLI